MRNPLLNDGAKELDYEIRGIVQKAEALEALGHPVAYENIGDPIQKNAKIPVWMKAIVTDLVALDTTYGYTHSRGETATRKFLAERNNALGGVQIDYEDVLFFNGLGDAIAKVYQFLHPFTRVIGPSPAYSTHSSAEAAHASKQSLTYKLDPANKWYPDMADLEMKIKYNPNITGILIINPDNPTGMVYPREILDQIVELAREYNLFLIADEIYTGITYNGAKAWQLSEYIGDVPGISMKGISKELPWPGSRCGWMEFYNREVDEEFDRLCKTLFEAKMIEVCSTTLPQKAIPKIFSHPEFPAYQKERNAQIGRRAKLVAELLGDMDEVYFNETTGAFYNTIVFKPGVLKEWQTLPIADPKIQGLVEEWTAGPMRNDKRFVYYLLAAKGVCVVPLSSFHCPLEGFRVTLLEENEELLLDTFSKIREAIKVYCASAVAVTA